MNPTKTLKPSITAVRWALQKKKNVQGINSAKGLAKESLASSPLLVHAKEIPGNNRSNASLAEVMASLQPRKPAHYPKPGFAGSIRYQAAAKFASLLRSASTDYVSCWERFERDIKNTGTDKEYVAVLTKHLDGSGGLRALDASYMIGGILLHEDYAEIVGESGSLRDALEELKNFHEENHNGLARCGGKAFHVNGDTPRGDVKKALHEGGFLEVKANIMKGDALLNAVVREFENHPIRRTKDWRTAWGSEKAAMKKINRAEKAAMKEVLRASKMEMR